MKVSPSILNANFANFEKEIKSISNCDFIHLDIMDGNFVPNISFGPSICEGLSKMTSKKLDIHLMVLEPLKWIPKFIFPTTKYLTIHAESKGAFEAIKLIKENNLQAGLCLKPRTSVKDCLHLLALVDLVLVMTVEPGFGGQAFLLNPSLKVEELIKYRKANKLHYEIEVDGGINNETIHKVDKADIVVVGSYLFKQKNRRKVIKDFQSLK